MENYPKRSNRIQPWQRLLSGLILVIAIMGGFFFDEAVAALQTLSLQVMRSRFLLIYEGQKCENFYCIFPFFLVVVVVHLFWSGVVRPHADLTLAQASANAQAIPRTLPIIFKDIEQEICVILLFWGSYMIGARLVSIWRHSYLFSVDILKQADDAHGDSTPSLTQTLNNLEQLPLA